MRQNERLPKRLQYRLESEKILRAIVHQQQLHSGV
jgi:hypothetical protein